MKRLTRFLGLVAAAAVLWFSGPARAQYTHRQNPGDTSQTLPSLSATGAYVCLGTAGAATDLLTLSGAATGATVAFWHTPDQVNYYALPLYPSPRRRVAGVQRPRPTSTRRRRRSASSGRAWGTSSSA